MKPQDTAKLLKKLDVNSFGKISNVRAKELVEKIQGGEISKEEWDYLKAVVPRFADVVSVGLTTISSLVSASAGAQSEAIVAIREGIAAAKEIAAKSTDPEVHNEALRLIDSAFDRIERMNRENNAWSGKALGLIAGVVGLTAVVIAGGKTAPKNIA